MAKRRATARRVSQTKGRALGGTIYTAGRNPDTGKPIYKNVPGKTRGGVKEKLKKAINASQQLDMTRAKSYSVQSWIKLWYEAYSEPRPREWCEASTPC